MYQRILVAVDNARLSRKAEKAAISLASSLGAELVAVHVVPSYPVSLFEGAVTVTAKEVSRIEGAWSTKGQALVAAVVAAAVAASATAAQLRPGDTLTVTLSGIPDPSTNPVQIDEQGSISLPFLGVIPAAGLNTGELAQAVRDAYIGRKFYTSISVSVTVTERYIYIGGEVQRLVQQVADGVRGEGEGGARHDAQQRARIRVRCDDSRARGRHQPFERLVGEV